MNHICPLCNENPANHSFSKIRETDGTAIYYTAPAKALDKDCEGIVLHYDLVLAENAMPWIWIFDCKDYSLADMLDMKLAIQLTELINKKYMTNLKKIIIVNSTTFIWTVISIVSLFMDKSMLDKIYISNEEYNL